jgi:hypothetical protein
VPFLLALATREDVGLHAFGFLAVWLTINRLRGARFDLRLAGFAIAALGYAGSALLAQHWAFPAPSPAPSRFVNIYVGEKLFSHVTWTLLATRLAGWPILHSVILLPAAATLVWALRARDPFLFAGYLACLPWGLLHLLAASPLAGWMVGYYAYPFVVAMAWPILAMNAGESRTPVRPALICLGLVALSLLPVGRDYDPGRIALPAAFLDKPSTELQRATDHAIAEIVAARPVLGRLLVDNSVASLAPRAFARAEIAGWQDGQADTIVFLEDGFDAARLRAVAGLPVHYAVPGTAIRLMTNRPQGILRDAGIAE